MPATDTEAQTERSALATDATEAQTEPSAQASDETEAKAERLAQASGETEAQTERPAPAADKTRHFPDPPIRRRRPPESVAPVKPSCNRTSSVTAQ
ncbi:hypothetical protein LL998_19390 [Burkholderia ambifaria]|uniref:hypothetical protein n=1 Tax=Burkholderia ambifaria TaxID=152480 RepID=UPI001E3EA92C|nr:hypothetical protein [Burkholderia ambifaria]UEP38129.1 hypothetical protein LL998_19390 [Burkholderia ambifaria]